MYSQSALSLIALLTFAPPSAAQQVDGNELLETCDSSNQTMQGFCLGFIIGQVEGVPLGAALSFWQAVGDTTDTEATNRYIENVLHYCVPDNAGNRQLIDVVVAHLRENPEERHNPARMQIWNAFRAAFPCG